MVRLSDRLATIVGRKLDRRGFLARAALGGTALAVAPIDFTLRPGDAYAAICRCNGVSCNCGARCCDGYTEFCCSIYGSNRCPPGSVIAGWWKVDGSHFCGGGPRYYMDCNASCGDCGCGSGGVCSGACSGTTCGCAFGDCNHWRAGCVQFRYGQCNQQIPCVGPITCRLVSCVPPWEIEPTCTTTVAVDEGTRFHTAPCLHNGRGALDVLEINRTRLHVAGWALVPDRAESVTVQFLIDGALAHEAVASVPRPDLAPVFPSIGIAHGYDVQFDVAPGYHRLTITALPPQTPLDRFEIATLPIGIGVPFGFVDVVGQVPGGVRVAGWVIDPDASGPSLVHIYVDGTFVASVRADLPRPDVAAAFPGFGPAVGFDTVIPAAVGARQVCAYAINSDGAGRIDPALNRLLACRSIEVTGRPIGNVDVVEPAPGGVRVAGWALDPETAQSLMVHVYVDGTIAGVAQADVPRPDVAATFPGSGPRHGFDTVVPALPGRRQVCAYAIDAGSGGSGNPLVGCREVVMGSRPFGHLDLLTRDGNTVQAAGWAIDPSTAAPIDVHVHVDGVPVAAARADGTRADVAAAHPLYGAQHGFSLSVPVAPGSHQVCVYAIGVTPSVNTLLACGQV
ncbi:MAG TPA: twin-arginine translocation signal domain-containing protein [Acidimicrobiales bacterium]